MTSFLGILSTNSLLRARVHSFVLPSIATHTARAALYSSSTSIPQTKDQELLVADAPVIILRRSRQSKAFRNGNQLVFTKSIQSGSADMSALVQVCVVDDNNNGKSKDGDSVKPQAQPIGWGVYNPSSLYKVRMLCHRYLQPSLYQQVSASISKKKKGASSSDSTQPVTTVDDALEIIVRHHLTVALRKRKALNLVSSEETNMYRLVNGEGDSLSGLQVDVINTHIVVQSSAAWTEDHKEVILRALQEVMPNYELIWKVAGSRLKQDGYDDDADSENGESSGEAVIALENGVQFQTFPAEDGQKTGIYADQRENRHTLAQYTKGKSVLDLCCYHGGFSLNSVVKGGASLAVGVDSSAAAVEAATKNAKLNGVSGDDSDGEGTATFLQSDIAKYMQSASADGIFYDVVVLDPPKLAPTAAMLEKARRKYHGLNRDAIKLVNPKEGGILMTCTCSAAMTQKDGGQYFLEMVAGAALAAGRQVTLLSKAGAASCHTESPVSWPAGAYLTAALFYVHPVE